MVVLCTSGTAPPPSPAVMVCAVVCAKYNVAASSFGIVNRRCCRGCCDRCSVLEHEEDRELPEEEVPPSSIRMRRISVVS